MTTNNQQPLLEPLYGASFSQAFVRFWQKFFIFSGRASRSEYWWWYLFAALVNTVLGSLSNIDGLAGRIFSAVSTAWGLLILIPTLALLWRRLHDTNRSGWWAFSPLLCTLVGFVLLGIGGGIALQHTQAAVATAIVFWFIAAVAFLAALVILLILTVLPANPAGVRFDRAP
ncbi:DUF805 domain-containing protein [Curtobacterium sp. A7_M15]|uniref:DUF805 domain-containing protein n=1 Tax=Curtobacterium sp. A7_M15 TaxID=3065241 RepID=UPI002737A6D6|nr:DUF805 domain-containing protein [Curtobacterium sp. A7_M15]MDP4331986.1 DUF805 domain-containing protein [Curtobacterium sp. A7_M15]